MIRLQNIVLQRGSLRLLDKASAAISSKDRVGIIGPNGCGKSSLFKLFLSELSLDEGEINIPKQWRITHMVQEISDSDRTALDYVIDGDKHLRQIQSSIKSIEAKIEQGESDQKRLAKLFAELESIDGYNAEYKSEQLLHGLGFTQSQVHLPVNEFSGGWRVRLNLAQALMCPSDLLLLDEPSNHLDLDATLWLEQWLKAYQGTLLLISHDRDFLDNVVTHIIHIEHQQLMSYRGNYSAYEKQRAERLAQQQAIYEKQQRRIAEIDRFVRRFRAKATKARQAQSRLKELSRMQAIAPAHVDSPFRFIFRDTDKLSDPLIDLRMAQFGYNDQAVLTGIKLSLRPGSRIGLLGMNGAGKSTLIKGLVGDLAMQSGERICGENLAVGYFAQHQLEALDLEATALLHIQRLSPSVTEQDIRNFLGGFNFQGDKAIEPVRLFSGGEKARIALAIIVWQRPNLLLLDEPTNHLDLEMRYALTVALQTYNGALVVISHDRHLLRNTVDEFYLVSKGSVEPFSGTLEDYQSWLKQEVQNYVNEMKEKAQSENIQGAEKLDKKALRQQAAVKREKLKPITSKIRTLENSIETAQNRLKQIENLQADASFYETSDNKDIQALQQEQGELRKMIQDKEELWLELQEKLEAVKSIDD